MRMMAFSARNRKEILRDPLSMLFGVGFPVIILSMLSLMKHSIKEMPNDVFGIASLAPGMAVFGLSFITLFLGMLIANDRSSSFLTRLFTSPLTGRDYIIGYSLPLLPVSLLQGIVCFAVAILYGLSFNGNILIALIVLIPVALLFISFGLLLGTLLNNSQQVGGISSVLINVTAWLSGTWFSLDMIGGVFKVICNILPFAHSVDAIKAAVSGDYASILPNLLWVLGYTIVLFYLAVLLFRKKMRG